jgi:hypothetical protein
VRISPAAGEEARPATMVASAAAIQVVALRVSRAPID